MTQFNEGKGYEGIGTIKIFDIENTSAEVKKKCHDHWEKGNMSDKSYIPTRGTYLQKFPQLLTLQINQSFSVMFQL